MPPRLSVCSSLKWGRDQGCPGCLRRARTRGEAGGLQPPCDRQRMGTAARRGRGAGAVGWAGWSPTPGAGSLSREGG